MMGFYWVTGSFNYYAHGWQNLLSELMNYSWLTCWIWQLLWLFFFFFPNPSISLFFFSAAYPLKLPLTSFCHESRTGGTSENLCRHESEQQKAEQLPKLVPLWGSLNEQKSVARTSTATMRNTVECAIPFLTCCFFKTLFAFCSLCLWVVFRGCRSCR